MQTPDETATEQGTPEFRLEVRYQQQLASQDRFMALIWYIAGLLKYHGSLLLSRTPEDVEVVIDPKRIPWRRKSGDPTIVVHVVPLIDIGAMHNGEDVMMGAGLLLLGTLRTAIRLLQEFTTETPLSAEVELDRREQPGKS